MSLDNEISRPTATATFTETEPQIREPSPTPQTDTGWRSLGDGMDRRLIRVIDDSGRQQDSLYLLRLEPEMFTFGVAYSPGKPISLADWSVETGALIVTNAGFFTPDFRSTGAIVVDGSHSGTSYVRRGGMFAVTAEGPSVRSLVSEPYNPAEPLLAAVQSFPMLVREGGTLGYSRSNIDRARRTVVAEDQNGRILFIIASWGSFTLTDLSRFLMNSDLELVAALNLDGGSSSGLLLSEPSEGIPAFTRLPAVITVYAK